MNEYLEKYYRMVFPDTLEENEIVRLFAIKKVAGRQITDSTKIRQKLS